MRLGATSASWRRAMALTGAQWQELSGALRSAFPPPAFDRLLKFALNINRYNIAFGDDYQDIVFRVLQTAEAEGWTMKLVAAARATNPGNPDLVETAMNLGIASATRQLEARVRQDAPFVDIQQWRETLGTREGQVCRVEVEAGDQSTIGTGFLVGPDLVLTNHHVIAPLLNGNGLVSDTVLRFDYKRTNGFTVHFGTEARLAQDWLVSQAPPGTADLDDDPTAEPRTDELDYALLRVATRIGDEAIALAGQDPQVPARGWVHGIAQIPVEGAPLLILQHPEGVPLKLALGTCGASNGNGSRVRHFVNTEPGSSGSPCMDGQLRLVALHHLGDPRWLPGGVAKYNQAVPVKAVVQHIRRSGVTEPILEPAA